jgi:hypothetical protein
MFTSKAYTVRQKTSNRQHGKGQSTKIIKFLNLSLIKSRSVVDVDPIYWPDRSGSVILNYGPTNPDHDLTIDLIFKEISEKM